MIFLTYKVTHLANVFIDLLSNLKETLEWIGKYIKKQLEKKYFLTKSK